MWDGGEQKIGGQGERGKNVEASVDARLEGGKGGNGARGQKILDPSRASILLEYLYYDSMNEWGESYIYETRRNSRCALWWGNRNKSPGQNCGFLNRYFLSKKK